jgi:hypothetical protein
MTFYTRRQIVELLDVEEGFVRALEQEEIIESDGPEPSKLECWSGSASPTRWSTTST